jgi:hypothetical protein
MRTVRRKKSTAVRALGQISLSSKKESGADCPPFASGLSAGQQKNSTVNRSERELLAEHERRRRGLSAVCKRTVRSSTEITEQQLRSKKLDARTVRRQGADGPPSDRKFRQSSECSFSNSSQIRIRSKSTPMKLKIQAQYLFNIMKVIPKDQVQKIEASYSKSQSSVSKRGFLPKSDFDGFFERIQI